MALLISVNIIPKINFTASAVSASAENTIDLGNNGQITKDGLENLFKRISGQNTCSSVKQAVSQSILTFNGSEVLFPFSMYALNSASFRKLNNDNNTSVKLGGLTWNLVFVTETINGDLVATLHLADDIGISSQWNKWFSTVDNKRISSQIYGESFIRSTLTGSKSVQYTITKRVINIIWSSEASWDYNGEAHAPVASVSTDFDDGRIEIVYILTAKEGSVLTDGKAIEPGEYVAKVTLNNADNYEIRGEREVTFKITGATPITPENPTTGIDWTIILVIGVIAAVLIAMIAVIVALAKGRKQTIVNMPRSDAGGFYDDYDGDDE